MVGLAFASVPLYRLFCQVTGFGGTTAARRRRRRPGAVGRMISVRFDANVSPALPWQFEPVDSRPQRVAIGARNIAFFTARNLSDRPVTGTATFNVTPSQAGQVFHQDPVLLLHRADAEAGRGGAHAGDLLRRSRRSSTIPTRSDISEITLTYTFYPVDQRQQRQARGRRSKLKDRDGHMAGAKNHDYHIVDPSIWPLIGAFSALAMFGGAVMWMHDDALRRLSCSSPASIGVLFTMFSWWADVIREAHAGDHTPVVQLHLRYGMILFIASEVMFFVAWFWAFFDSSLFPSDGRGGRRRLAAQGHRTCSIRSASRCSTR